MANIDERVDDIMNNSIEAKEVSALLDDALEQLKGYDRVFPLQTIQSMAERWGVSRQNVYAWSKRHDDFPKELEGIIEKTDMTPKVYALKDVERYERNRGLLK